MKSNEELKNAIISALKNLLPKDASEIRVKVVDGFITLSGNIDDSNKGNTAAEAVTNANAVDNFADEIEIGIRNWELNNDREIASEVSKALRLLTGTGNILQIKVEDGWVTLAGELEWNYQKDAATTAAGNLMGVKGVTNNIVINSDAATEVHQVTIERALKSHAAIDTTGISVAVSGRTVILSGTVDSSYEKELAGRIAWKAPGVTNVDNQLAVR